jgi:TM2 domain-containing membrane protein YozV
MSDIPPPHDPGAPPPYPPYGSNAWGAPAQGVQPGAPYGIDPLTGLPYSERSKVIAGVLQILVPLGIGRFYMGQTNLGLAQLLVTIFTCGIGALWPFVDGILLLVGHPVDAEGRPLR